jgi:hypothetical protein
LFFFPLLKLYLPGKTFAIFLPNNGTCHFDISFFLLLFLYIHLKLICFDTFQNCCDNSKGVDKLNNINNDRKEKDMQIDH